MARLGVEPEIVVNNAGFGLLGPAARLSRAEQLAMIDVNVRALTDLSLAFVDSLERHRGGILNVASVAAFLPGPNMAVYYATKAYVLSFSEALHWELRPRGIRVTALCPGPVPTEFQARAGFTDDPNPDMLTQSADEVAEDGYRGLRRGRRVVGAGLPEPAHDRLITRLLPRSLLMAAVGRYNRQALPARNASSVVRRSAITRSSVATTVVVRRRRLAAALRLQRGQPADRRMRSASLCWIASSSIWFADSREGSASGCQRWSTPVENRPSLRLTPARSSRISRSESSSPQPT